jgi:hypothetical protein
MSVVAGNWENQRGILRENEIFVVALLGTEITVPGSFQDNWLVTTLLDTSGAFVDKKTELVLASFAQLEKLIKHVQCSTELRSQHRWNTGQF